MLLSFSSLNQYFFSLFKNAQSERRQFHTYEGDRGLGYVARVTEGSNVHAKVWESSHELLLCLEGWSKSLRCICLYWLLQTRSVIFVNGQNRKDQNYCFRFCNEHPLLKNVHFSFCCKLWMNTFFCWYTCSRMTVYQLNFLQCNFPPYMTYLSVLVLLTLIRLVHLFSWSGETFAVTTSGHWRASHLLE